MNLREATKELHHAAEHTALGNSMANGTIPEQWWADWLSALYTVHSAIDYYLEPELRRTTQIAQDIYLLNVQPRPLITPIQYVSTLNEGRIEAATYVFTGAHLMGGAITAKALGDRLPKNHLLWDDRRSEVVRKWSPLRERLDLVEYANEAFSAIVDMCHEIEGLDEQNG